jgi:hypothetical protein
MKLILIGLFLPISVFADASAVVFQCHATNFYPTIEQRDPQPFTTLFEVQATVTAQGESLTTDLELNKLGDVIKGTMATEIREISPDTIGADQFSKAMSSMTKTIGNKVFSEATSYKSYRMTLPSKEIVAGLKYFKGNDVIASLFVIPGIAIGVCE